MNTQIKYLLFLKIIHGLSRIRPIALGYMLARITGKYFSPRTKENQTIYKNLLLAGLPDEQAKVEVNKFHQHAAINYLHSYLFKKMNQKWVGQHIIINGLEHINRGEDEGLLILSSHQHHLMMLGTALGVSGEQIFPILMAPEETVPAFLEHYYNMAIANSEKQYNGGKYLLVKLKPTYTRNIYRVLKNGGIVISANDFPDNIAPKRRTKINLIKREISCPTGTIEIALKSKTKFVSAFVTQGLHPPFVIDILPIDPNIPTVESITNIYSKHLNHNIQSAPAAWEGWKWDNLYQ
jgi:lauroyl/myristoyl acyltransferase